MGILLLDTNDTTYYNTLLQYLINRHTDKEQTYKTYNIGENDLENYKNYLNYDKCPFPIYNLPIPHEYDANIEFGRYLNNPCIKTATQLFKKLKLSIPLLELLTKEKNDLQHTIFEKHTKDTKDTSIKNNILDDDKIRTYNTLLRLVFLYDIHNIHISGNFKNDVSSLILHDLDIDTTYKQLFIDTFTHNSKNCTKIFSDYFIHENQEKCCKTIQSDKELYDTWLSWIKNKTLKIVLDGIFIQYEAIHYIQNSNESQFCASMIQSAYILLLFHNAHKIYQIHNKTQHNIYVLEEIILVDGVFNKIERFFTIKYYKKYLDSLKKSSKTNKIQLETIGAEIQPIYYKKYYNNYTYIETIDNHIQIHIDENIIFTTHHNSIKINKINKIKHELSHTINSINMYYDKEELLDFIYEIVSKDENTKFKKLLNILIDFNFLKDAYRVDVSIQTDSVFITYDLFAFIYYNLIVKWEKKDNKSLFIRAPLIINNRDPSIQVIIP